MPLYKRQYPVWFEHTWRSGPTPTTKPDEEMAE